MSRAFDPERDAERKRAKKAELDRKVQEFKDKLNRKALNCLLNDTTVEVDKALLVVEINKREYHFALKPMPVRLTHVTATQHECFVPNAAVALQAMDWCHDDHAGGAIVRCTLSRNNHTSEALAPLQFKLEGHLGWKHESDPTAVFLQGNGWTVRFQYTQGKDKGQLRLVDAEYDCNVGEATMRALTEQTTQAAIAANAVGTKRKAAAAASKEDSEQRKQIKLLSQPRVDGPVATNAPSPE